MAYTTLTVPSLRTELAIRGLPTTGPRSELIARLVSADDSEFVMFDARNDSDGKKRGELISKRWEKEVKRVEVRCEGETARARRVRGVEREEVGRRQGLELARLEQILVREKNETARSEQRIWKASPDGVGSVLLRETEGVLPAGSQTRPIDLDPEDATTEVETPAREAEGASGVFVREEMTHTVLPSTNDIAPAHPNSEDTTSGSQQPRPATTKSPHSDLNNTTNIHETRRKRLLSTATSDSTQPHKKRRTQIEHTSKQQHEISTTPILTHLPTNTNYIFIPATTLPVHHLHLPHIKRMLRSWLKEEDISADETGYFAVFGDREEDGKRARQCAEYFNKKGIAFNGEWVLRMVLRRKA